ncbi:hypothetical protein CRE_08659 [Caenorhabditis remanei]|uniref:C-type lectin domain-containing protein n=1 Tax=Caenorhabditis remanei TaxID=31234 RepID=E3LJ83_CAERE|nr:hypothetical protein CRE_08659 [Caenorhabditis remanei]
MVVKFDDATTLEENDNGALQTHFENSVAFVMDHWKPLLIGGISVFVLLVSVFLITFFATSLLLRVHPKRRRKRVQNLKLRQKLVYFLFLNSVNFSFIHSENSTTITSVTPPDSYTTVDPRNQSCTNHFTLINGKCWRMFNLTHSRTSADGICFLHNGATLVSIKSANENRALVDFVKNEHLDTVWTGLLCNNGTNITSCIWDIQAGTAARYSNFEAGYPDVTYGGCVYFTASGKAIGQWGSAQCSQSMAFVCELPATVLGEKIDLDSFLVLFPDETCIFNYNGNCYTRFDNYWNFSGAQRECESRCSNLVSIHSANEMRFIQTIYSDVQSAFIRIGGIAMSQDFLIWTDGSPGDFDNIQYFQPGSCIIMATGTSKSGYWYTHPCDQGYVYLCKRPAGVHC